MTKIYHIQTQAEDLKIGDLFLHWAVMEDDLYPEASRIIEITENENGRQVKLEDGRDMPLRNEIIVVIQDIA